MAASVRIEDEAFSDTRYQTLAREAGLADADHARGKMALIWRQCTAEQRYILTRADVESVLGKNAVAALEMSRLGFETSKGIRIAGTKGRIEWLKRLRENGLKGGRPRKPKGSHLVTETKTRCKPEPNPPAPAPAPAQRQKTKDIAAAPPRPRNELFDAIAEVTGLDPSLAGSVIGKVSANLKAAGYSPDEVREFGRRYWEFCPYARDQGSERPTPTELEKYIGRIRAGPAPPQTARGVPRTKAQEISDTAARSLKNILENQTCPPQSGQPAIQG